MDTADWVNQAILDLWRRTFKENDDVFIPLIYPKIEKSVLLFISLNPSFTEKGHKEILKDSDYSKINYKEFFHWKNWEDSKLQRAIEIEKLYRNKYSFFTKFKEIAKYAKIGWEHIDLFFIRETNQKKCLSRICKDKVLNEFGRSQLELSKRLITEAKPIAIVVANAFASRIFEWKFKATFNEDKGYHEISLNKKILPVFLGSMLTGQRAMDNYSFRRLKWQIKKVIEKLT